MRSRVSDVPVAATIVPPVLFMFKFMPLEPVKWIMLAATVVWFTTAPVRMKADGR